MLLVYLTDKNKFMDVEAEYPRVINWETAFRLIHTEHPNWTHSFIFSYLNEVQESRSTQSWLALQQRSTQVVQDLVYVGYDKFMLGAKARTASMTLKHLMRDVNLKTALAKMQEAVAQWEKGKSNV